MSMTLAWGPSCLCHTDGSTVSYSNHLYDGPSAQTQPRWMPQFLVRGFVPEKPGSVSHEDIVLSPFCWRTLQGSYILAFYFNPRTVAPENGLIPT